MIFSIMRLKKQMIEYIIFDTADFSGINGAFNTAIGIFNGVINGIMSLMQFLTGNKM